MQARELRKVLEGIPSNAEIKLGVKGENGQVTTLDVSKLYFDVKVSCFVICGENAPEGE